MSSLSAPLSCVMLGVWLVRTGPDNSIQSQAITEFNYANQVQLNDSSNNRLAAER